MARSHGKTNGNGRTKAASSQHASYDAFKEFQGRRYTGMKVGRGHKWHYDAGEWNEKKLTPDKWEFRYAVNKRRRGKAPEGSGVPVGTAYHWYILADQTVTKCDANSYTTDMVGFKYKLAHKRADKAAWSASERAQKKRLIQLLRETIAQLEREIEHAAAAKPQAKTAKTASRKRKAARAGEHRAAA
jgi:hypothetical protein